MVENSEKNYIVTKYELLQTHLGKVGNIQKDKDIEKKVSIISSGDFVIPFMNLTLNRILQSHPIDYFKGLTNLLKLLINLHLKKVWSHCALARG